MAELNKNTFNNHKKFPKWLIPLLIIAVILIICIAVLLIRRNSNEKPSATDTAVKSGNTTAQVNKTDESKTIDPDSDTDNPDSQETPLSEPEESDSSTAEVPKESGAAGTPDASGTDMSGDYMGTLTCPLPPISEGYRVFNANVPNDLLMLYIENIDDANIRFYLTRATEAADLKSYTEEILFPEHIAHYTESGYYEYFDDEYHLYFKYSVLGEHAASQKKVDVFGFDSIYDPNSYNSVINYNGMTGNQFSMGHPISG